MKPLFLSFLFLFTLTSAQSINNYNLNSFPNVAPNMQPAGFSSESKASSPTNYYSSYPPGYENENSPSESPSHIPNYDISLSPNSPISESESSEFSSIYNDSISSSDDHPGTSGFSSSLISSTNKQKDEGKISDDNTSIKKICDNTDYPDLCTATVAPFQHGSAVNVERVLQMAMKASNQFAKTGFAAVKRASESPAIPPRTKEMLKTCLDSWDTVLYNYEQAIEALRIHDTGRMSTMLSAAITDVSDCEDAFEGVVSPLIPHGEKMTKMTSNCLAIVSQLQS